MTRKTTIKRCVRATAAALCALYLGGCVEIRNVDPEIKDIQQQNLELSELPEITLVRRVIPSYHSKRITYYPGSVTEEISRSKFGEPNDIADLGCAIDGIRKSLPEVDIVPTETFWNRVPAEKESMILSELLTAPTSKILKELRVESLVVAYHKIIDVEGAFFEIGLGGYAIDKDLETVAILVIEMENNSILHTSRVTFEDYDAYSHNLGLYLWSAVVTTATSDPCNVAGEQAGAAIAYALPKPAPRILVVAAGNNPYDAVQATSREEKREKEMARLEAECNLPFSEAIQLEATTQYETGQLCSEANNFFGWQLMCLAAHRGYAKAQYAVGKYFLFGREPTPKDPVTAHVWFSLAKVNGLTWAYVPRITPAEIAEAERLVAEWEPSPAECEIEAAQSEN